MDSLLVSEMMKRSLVDVDLEKIIDSGALQLYGTPTENPVQSNSIDIPVAKYIVSTSNIFTPFDAPVKKLVDKYGIRQFDLADSPMLHKRESHVTPFGFFNPKKLPKELAIEDIRISAKSSGGRTFIQSRVIADNHGLYDHIPLDKPRELWLEMTPQPFALELPANEFLSQMRFITRSRSKARPEEVLLLRRGTHNYLDGKIGLTVDVTPGQLVALKAKKDNNRPVNLSYRYHYSWDHYFEPIFANSQGEIFLESEAFYLMKSFELLDLSPEYCLQIDQSSSYVGKIITHEAGFVDGNFGRHPTDPTKSGAVIVFEISVMQPTLLRHKQPLCYAEIIENVGQSRVSYGQQKALDGRAKNNYQLQRDIVPAKYFTMPDFKRLRQTYR